MDSKNYDSFGQVKEINNTDERIRNGFFNKYYNYSTFNVVFREREQGEPQPLVCVYQEGREEKWPVI